MFDNGTQETVTSDVVAQAFYCYLAKGVSWEAVRRVHALWIEAGAPA